MYVVFLPCYLKIAKFNAKPSRRDNDWGISNYPLVLGHEGIATVRKVGSSVRNVKVGDVIGITWARDSCLCCDSCMEGRENICEKGYQGVYLGPGECDQYLLLPSCLYVHYRLQYSYMSMYSNASAF